MIDFLYRFFFVYLYFSDDVLAMAKHQRRSFATDKSPQSYHDEMHRPSYHQKTKFVTKPNLHYVKNQISRNEYRRSR